MTKTVFAITPPFTQLNTPYPATAYIKGFLNTKNISCFQADLGIEVILALFSKKGLTALFDHLNTSNNTQWSENAQRIIALEEDYIQTVDAVIGFLQGKNPTLANQICQDSFLPEASRFAQLEDLEWAFGSMGMQDKAKHLATLYLEDLSDLISECVDPYFGFSRYAERLGRSANSFDELYGILQEKYSYIDKILIEILAERMAKIQPKLLLISVPFPGNLYSAFRVGQWVKKNFPNTKVAMGGGFANTELRSLSDARVFEFFDFISLDDGEAPLEEIINTLSANTLSDALLKRTFILEEGKVVYKNNSLLKDYKQSEVGTPDYSDLLLDKYISVIEIVNPMHRMWSDGRWNKLTMAHGCYWGKCTFCDISLDYIKIYEPVAAKLLCDRMEQLIEQTGENGFHFVDEAAPPALMRALALEILRRKLTVTWWTNIRFEKSFSRDLCQLLKASGCIAVSGGLEVASDRLLDLIQKGVTVAQVAQVTRNFTEAGIMVHAYLMYGFPTQTAQETIDSLEMVRQMFEIGTLQSGFWHQFAMTAHSPVGMYPEKFAAVRDNYEIGSFANNDLTFADPKGADHEAFSYGLKKSLLNYMHGMCFDYPLQEWFDFKVPRTKIPKNYIENALLEDEGSFLMKPNTKVVWLGKKPSVSYANTTKKGQTYQTATLTFHDKKETFSLKLNEAQGEWLVEILEKISTKSPKVYTFQEIKDLYEKAGFEDFELFWYNKPVNLLRDYGLLGL
ncbi:Radical SAM domain protein [Emticicia oligotrophica DSM 17448]|uniref:Radical SAM domain protein n=1 Tax=Emticicia oligotrophica (strain DSM 17448 / CIP 109782 / MTCC 6937 / GPTSA100-15) TaxID=929562 RepID=A0ABM5MXU1_EMTOG|nr:radical SAM protein [Emticicia oligotrophica]AFK01961.1 Radical SAM domain protein [Emticicia oligotrophica DSM 17448]